MRCNDCINNISIDAVDIKDYNTDLIEVKTRQVMGCIAVQEKRLTLSAYKEHVKNTYFLGAFGTPCLHFVARRKGGN